VVVTAALPAQESPSELELSRHLATLRSEVENTAVELPRRAALVLEMGDTLDRAAQAAAAESVRRRRWSEAVDLIDAFLRRNPGAPRERALRLQAGVYRWALAQSWQQDSLLAPADPKPRQQAIAALDDAIERLRACSGDGGTAALDQNQRFRLAQALADRADFEPAGSPGRAGRESEALRQLDPLPHEAGLTGYWHLLRADLLRRAGKLAQAVDELDAASKATPAPRERELIDVRVKILVQQNKGRDALTEIERSGLERSVKSLWLVRVLLSEWGSAQAESERFRIESELFRWVNELRQGNSRECRLALLDLVHSAIKPDEKHPLDVWAALGDAHGAAGQPVQAASHLLRAADKAAAAGHAPEAAEFRLRAGAFLFQAGKFDAADTPLGQVAADPAAGASRCRAGMLRALARGRALASGSPGATLERYQGALDSQIRDFSRDPITDEARWLRGRIALAASDRALAEALWTVISPESPRWLESRLGLVGFDRDELERRSISAEPQELRTLVEKIDHFLAGCLKRARSGADIAELRLARARLNLTPLAGNAESARIECDKVRASAAGLPAVYRARLLRIVAQVALARFVEADREAENHASWRVAGEDEALCETIRLLDQCAASSPSELGQRRFGHVLRTIVEPLLSDAATVAPDQRAELAMRFTRSLLFVGADREARRSLASWHGTPPTTSDRLLRDLGDTYSRLALYTLAVDVQRLRIKQNPGGSLSWLDARYELALAYFRTGQLDSAARLIEATQILYPELGGGSLRDRFVHLRQRLGVNP
jgi:tetratricopeptide (TPR) repeat protein